MVGVFRHREVRATGDATGGDMGLLVCRHHSLGLYPRSLNFATGATGDFVLYSVSDFLHVQMKHLCVSRSCVRGVRDSFA